MDRDAINRALLRRLEPAGIFPSKDEAIASLAAGSRRVYLGIDPTGPDIHLGHSVPLLFLKQLWELGHQPVIVIGDFTARIGDPTDKESARKPLSPEEIKINENHYVSQIEKILPRGSFEVKHNNDWLSKLSFGDVLQLASHVTVQQMEKRSMFQERVKKEEPIGVHEFLYPLMQGYDSVAMKIDGEVGGNDQTFNMMVGRDLERKILKKEKLVFATRLLVDTTSGKKMSKSEGEIIALSDEPREIRRKVLAMDDGMIKTMFELCTEKPLSWIEERSKSSSPRELKEELADELVRMYHGESAVAESRSGKEVSGGPIVDVLVKTLSMSKSEAKRLLDQSAVEINGQPVTDWNHQTKSGDKLQVGKGRFIEIK